VFPGLVFCLAAVICLVLVFFQPDLPLFLRVIHRLVHWGKVSYPQANVNIMFIIVSGRKKCRKYKHNLQNRAGEGRQRRRKRGKKSWSG